MDVIVDLICRCQEGHIRNSLKHRVLGRDLAFFMSWASTFWPSHDGLVP